MPDLKIAVLTASLILSLSCHAQSQTHSDKEYSKHPLWIEMMDDSTANYFEIKKAFDLFWQNKPLPTEEEEIIGERNGKAREKESFLHNLFKSKKEKREEDSNKYAFAYKKFKRWELINLPYVQEDGRILTASERLELWKKSR